MINFNFALTNPFSCRWECIWTKDSLVSKNKAFEFSVYSTNQIIAINTSLSVTGDHAGLMFEFGLLGFSIEFNFYDTRHWDYDNNCWKKYGKGS